MGGGVAVGGAIGAGAPGGAFVGASQWRTRPDGVERGEGRRAGRVAVGREACLRGRRGGRARRRIAEAGGDGSIIGGDARPERAKG